MVEGISATTWFLPPEPTDCPLCAEARGRLSPDGTAVAGEIAIDLASRAQVASMLRAVISRLSGAVAPGRVSLLVPETAGRWRVFASSAEHETHDLVVYSDRYPELLETSRTSTPFVVADVASATALRTAREVLATAGVRSLAAYPIFRTSPAAESAVLKVSFYHPVRDDDLALATLVAHLLLHRLSRVPLAEVASQLGLPAPQETAAATQLRLLPLPALVLDTSGQVLRTNARARWLLHKREPAGSGELPRLWLRPDRPWETHGTRWEAALLRDHDEVEVIGWSASLPGDRHLVLLDPHPEARRRVRERAIRRTLAEKLRELEGANALLADYARVRDRFVSDAAHELKTPLAILRSYLEALSDDLAAGLSQQQREFVLGAAHGAERLQRLTDELLDLAALESGRLPLTLGPVSLQACVSAVLEELRPLAQAAGVGLGDNDVADITARADGERLRQVLRNLIENGLKYTRPPGDVAVSAECRDDRALICVCDNGVGIPPDALPHIFDEFVRVPGNSVSSGSGLGLAIVRRLVLAMGGRVWADSHPGSGSRFFVELPLWTGEG
ncbi:MAG: HAMP domain-containing sensor histidine kinase [Thermoanaerobaculaceae bacterium]|jgi:signal transduction histidine kinase